MRSNVFIVTKPIQLITALSIMKQLVIAASSDVVVVDSFAGASGVAQRLGALSGPLSGIQAHFVRDTREAYRLVRSQKISTLFIDSDVGFVRFRELLAICLYHSKVKISVYEEGIGTYRTDLYANMKKRLLRLIGAGTHFGGCKLTSSLYLYRTGDYARLFPHSTASLVPIETQPMALVKSFAEDLSILFGHNVDRSRSGKRCNVYLSSWTVDDPFIVRLKRLPGDTYVKLHPHISSSILENEDELLSIPSGVPAELALSDLTQRYDSVTVYHHGSSVEQYATFSNLSYVRI